MAYLRQRHDLAASFGQDCTIRLRRTRPNQNGIVLSSQSMARMTKLIQS
jgi:hypothetical protein